MLFVAGETVTSWTPCVVAVDVITTSPANSNTSPVVLSVYVATEGATVTIAPFW